MRAPTLLLEAEYSVAPAGQLRRMAELGSDVEYLRVPGAGHLIHDDAPQDYRRAVSAFLRSH